MPGPLITRRDILTGAVSTQKRKFGAVTGKVNEARVFFYFQTANVPEVMPHALGRKPTQWRLASVSISSGAPGKVYSPVNNNVGTPGSQTDVLNTMTKNFIVLACETAASWAEVIVS